MSSVDVLGILPEERFECSICRDVFSDPVTTPCGHTFCKACIGERWDSSEICQCPKCSKRFHARPEVSTNSLVEEISSQIKRRRVDVKEEPPLHAGEVPCDLCVGRRFGATKSCLVCLASLCETHLKSHYSVSTLTRHQLVEPLANIEEKICQKHQRLLGMYCRDDQMVICPLCTETDHRDHHTVSLEEEAPRQKEKIQTMIRQRKEKMEEVELSREKTKKELEDVDQLFTSLMDQVKAKHRQLKSTMEGKRQEMENKANAMVEELGWEITELQERSNELEENRDPLHLLQYFQTAEKLCTHPPTNTGWFERSHYSDVRGALSHLVADFCRELKTVTGMELKKMREYKELVTMDPNTASRWLTLSEGGKRGKFSNRPNPVTDDNPKRFDYCPMVLGEKGFTSGRHYWEVLVGVRADWEVGVAKETVDRKGMVNVKRENGFFFMRKRGSDYTYNDFYCRTLPPGRQLRKVGVYLDYEEGRVSFYDVDTKLHIYSLTGETFTVPLFPYFYVHSKKKNGNGQLLIT